MEEWHQTKSDGLQPSDGFCTLEGDPEVLETEAFSR